MLSFINFQYFFDAYPPRIQTNTFLILLILSIILVILGTGLKFLLKNKNLKLKIDKYQKILIIKLANLFLTAGIVNIILIYFRKFRVPYFQIRFVLILWCLIMITWLISITQNYLVKTPELRERDKKRREYEKYL
ncbi:hypothetical protein K8R66_03430 [bacterium]|nr:hypothetical protein [bacterium]